MVAVAKHPLGTDSALMVDTSGGLVLAAINPSLKLSNLSAAGTTTLKTGAGVLVGLTVNTGVTGGVVTIYNNTSGAAPLMGTFAAVNQGSYQLNWPFTTGLTIVITNAPNVTLTYI